MRATLKIGEHGSAAFPDAQRVMDAVDGAGFGADIACSKARLMHGAHRIPPEQRRIEAIAKAKAGD